VHGCIKLLFSFVVVVHLSVHVLPRRRAPTTNTAASAAAAAATASTAAATAAGLDWKELASRGGACRGHGKRTHHSARPVVAASRRDEGGEARVAHPLVALGVPDHPPERGERSRVTEEKEVTVCNNCSSRLD